MDAWQAALEDVGPARVDKGKGGKHLILPRDYFSPSSRRATNRSRSSMT